MAAKPSAWLVAACGAVAVISLASGVYFGGTGRIPLAMIGTAIFVAFGGLTFELARRRSV